MVNGKPVICIVSSSDYLTYVPGKPRKLELSEDYSAAFANAGFIPLHCTEYCAEDLPALCDALCLSGGPDLESYYFGEETLNDTVITDPPRSVFEYAVSRAFLAVKKPIFATCRGFQVLNCVLGGTLYQDIVEQLGFIHGDPKLRHYVTASDGSVLKALFGERFKVNSTHHQAIKDLGDGLFTTAVSAEGIIEAYEHKSLPIIGTQFHPERLTGKNNEGGTPDFAPLYRHFAGIVKERLL
ncbi:MAG: gamma-glutamyl-gamma-aminobutyrate hydrolase family protein [Clostridia bacterium]|nr:gamma-glutamyl-gamma-aminobutyrate hydrolase family protein [Clostridia bacterium]